MSFPFPSSYQLITLTGNIVVAWPFSSSTNLTISDWNNVTTNSNGYTITLPDAKLASTGQNIIFNNISNYSFGVLANDGVTILSTINSGEIKYFNLNNTGTSNGTWDIVPFGGGTTSITAFTAQSLNKSIVITNGAITPPGGTINFELPTSITNLNNMNVVGFPALTNSSTLTWASRDILGGNNITITDGNGKDGDPIVNLSPTLDQLISIKVGNISFTGSAISSIDNNSGININSQGTGILGLNGVNVDVSGNVSNVNNLSVNGTFYNPFTPQGWCFFTDTLIGVKNNNIILRNQANILSVTGAAGQYVLTFINPTNTHDYGVLITVGTEIIGGIPIVAHGFSIMSAQTTSKCQIAVVDGSGQYIQQAPNGITVQILSRQ